MPALSGSGGGVCRGSAGAQGGGVREDGTRRRVPAGAFKEASFQGRARTGGGAGDVGRWLWCVDDECSGGGVFGRQLVSDSLCGVSFFLLLALDVNTSTFGL